MKKKNLLVLLAVSTSLLSSCGNNDYSPVATVFADESLTECIDIEYGTFSSMMDDKMNFAIAQYPENHCSCWIDFKNDILYPYVENTHMKIYQIRYSAFAVDGRNTYGLDVRSDRPGFFIIEDGNVKFQTIYANDNDIFHDYDSFKGWMSNFVYTPTVYYINKEQLEALFTGNKNFIIYYTWSVCPDCTYLERNHFEEYFTNLKGNYPKTYIIDCWTKGIMLDEQGEYNRELWFNFANKYNLSDEVNPKFGYFTGAVPSLQYVEPNGTFNPSESIKSAFVYVNDMIEEINGQYVITESFFSEERLPHLEYLKGVSNSVVKGKVLSADEVNISASGNISWKHENSAKSYDPLFDAFMNYYKDKIN